MALQRIDGLISFSDHFGVERDRLYDLGAFNPLLDVDLPYAIDPKLLQQSDVDELATAHNLLLQRYRDIYRLLSVSKANGDRAWRAAEVLVTFPEFKGACLGFSTDTAAGRGWGPVMRGQILRSAKEIIDLGVTDPRFFELMGVFEEGIGPDLISDMVGTILLEPLRVYTKRVCESLGIPTQAFTINGTSYQLPGYLAEQGQRERYVILIPEDILTEMPIALDRSGVAIVAEHNEATRAFLNGAFGRDWQKLTKEKKWVARAALLSNADVLREFIETYENREAVAYNFDDDPRNRRLWYDLARSFIEASAAPKLTLPEQPSSQDVLTVALEILKQFKRNVELNGLWQLFYNDDGTPRREAIIQRAFQAVAQAYCKANNLDLAAEPNAGRGPVDFKVSRGASRVLIEFKRSLSTKLLHGYREQLRVYAKAEEASDTVYVVVDFGEHDVKMGKLYDEHVSARNKGLHTPILVVIEAWKHESGSRA